MHGHRHTDWIGDCAGLLIVQTCDEGLNVEIDRRSSVTSITGDGAATSPCVCEMPVSKSGCL
jgi:hypothetical protein